MKENRISLTQAEWSVMECLWEAGPLTGREVVQSMEKSCGWSRSTTLTLLSRLENKGALKSVPAEKGPKELDELYELLKGLEEERHD